MDFYPNFPDINIGKLNQSKYKTCSFSVYLYVSSTTGNSVTFFNVHNILQYYTYMDYNEIMKISSFQMGSKLSRKKEKISALRTELLIRIFHLLPSRDVKNVALFSR